MSIAQLVGTTNPYLDHVVSLSLDDILAQPALISAEAATVDAELVNLCYREYPTFLSVHHCSAAVESAFDDFDTSLTALLDSVPALEQGCREFSSHTEQDRRARVAVVQEHQNRIVELLELPQLVETCVRNGFYQEALELSRHPALLIDNPLAKDVAREVGEMLELMVTCLVGLLREPVKLATCVKAINFLKRLDVEELGLVFLTSRMYNYRSALQQLNGNVRRYIDLFREHVYDMISQYSSMFDAKYLDAAAGECVDDLLQMVAENIPKMEDAAALSSIVVQLGYCAMSFARVGLDFGVIAGTVFEVVAEGYVRAVDLAAKEFGTHKRITVFYNAHINALNALRLLAPVESQNRIVRAQRESIQAATTILVLHVNKTLRPETAESPRAHLLRRSTETLLSPEALKVKHDETMERCLKMKKQWQELMPALVGCLGEVYGVELEPLEMDI